MEKLENGWAKLLQEGKTVKVEIKPVYQDTDIRPTKFNVSYSIDNGRFRHTEILNQVGG